MLHPPMPLPSVTSPPCIMKPGITLCNGLPLYPIVLEAHFGCCAPVHSPAKFCAVLGAASPYIPRVIRPRGLPSASSSSHTLEVTFACGAASSNSRGAALP
eukprot:TRINITY_DN22785_c0_g1_i1.p1 TRINITY_DN22785_c0_g1~~TRINITY_DN22785_c0_g1_i1.p1  ORF type:complete len:101 (-),score=4.71 TRINITY_DN22785_c0_g1_i1:108-410(-)